MRCESKYEYPAKLTSSGYEVDYAMRIKIYGQSPEEEKRYSLSKYIGEEFRKIMGNP